MDHQPEERPFHPLKTEWTARRKQLFKAALLSLPLFHWKFWEGIEIEKLSWHQKMLLSREIKMKCHSFHEDGYIAVDEDQLVNYLISYRWKDKAKLSIRECKSDILHIQPNDFFDYQQLKAQTSPFRFNDWTDIQDLL